MNAFRKHAIAFKNEAEAEEELIDEEGKTLDEVEEEEFDD
jgi:hypothetical protein